MKLLLLVSLVVLTGCASSGHSRYDAAGNLLEKSRTWTFFMTGKASNYKSKISDNGYTREVELGSLEGSGDAELVNAIYEAGKAAGKKAATGQ